MLSTDGDRCNTIQGTGYTISSFTKGQGAAWGTDRSENPCIIVKRRGKKQLHVLSESQVKTNHFVVVLESKTEVIPQNRLILLSKDKKNKNKK